MANPVLSDALTEAGVTYRKLDYWTRLSLVVPDALGGSGNRRSWPARELEVARRLGILTGAGLTLARAGEVARNADWATTIPHMARHPAGTALDWQDAAACGTTDPELFYPDGQGTPNRHARTICRSCKVRQECLDYALEHDVEYGIWGGMTARERRRLMAARRREEKAS